MLNAAAFHSRATVQAATKSMRLQKANTDSSAWRGNVEIMDGAIVGAVAGESLAETVAAAAGAEPLPDGGGSAVIREWTLTQQLSVDSSLHGQAKGNHT